MYEVQELSPASKGRSTAVKQESVSGMNETGKTPTEDFDGKKSSIVTGAEGNTIEDDSLPKSPTMQS
jgi:hypothetical protein